MNGINPPTIYDVAKLAGVSAASVSRALSGSGASLATQERVTEAARKLGYRFNPMARALNTGMTHTLAFIVPDVTNPVFATILRGAEEAAGAEGFTLLLVDSHEDENAELEAYDRLARSADGFLLVTPRTDEAAVQNLAANIQTVVINRAVEGVPSVVADVEPGTVDTISHLHELGHRHVAFIPGPSKSRLMQLRWQIAEREAARKGMDFTLLPSGVGTIAHGTEIAPEVLATGATAAICFNDLIAIGLAMSCHAADVPLPAALSIVGYDDVFGPAFAHPPLTSVALPAAELGRRACRMLIQHLTNHSQPIDEPPLVTALVVRESTAAPGSQTPPTPRSHAST